MPAVAAAAGAVAALTVLATYSYAKRKSILESICSKEIQQYRNDKETKLPFNEWYVKHFVKNSYLRNLCLKVLSCIPSNSENKKSSPQKKSATKKATKKKATKKKATKKHT